MAQEKNHILNSVFTRTMLKKCLLFERNDVLNYFADKYELQSKTNNEIFEYLYKVMKNNYRNEYYYKNTLLNKLLLGVHSVRTTTALAELPIANSKADFILINGKAVVYEIKTELDNIERLENQIYDYYKAFNHVAVVTCENNLESIINLIRRINKPVGLYCLRKNGAIGLILKPLPYNDMLNINVVFNILRKNEYEGILKKYYEYLPKVSSFTYYSECKKMFLKLPLDSIYSDFLQILKKRIKVDESNLKTIPYEIKYLAYFSELKENDYFSLHSFLAQKSGGV